MRIRDQAAFPYARFLESSLVSLRLALQPELRRITPGLARRGDRIAIYHAYQPGGLKPSTWDTFAHLVDKGYSLAVVSHAPLTEADRARLRETAFAILERPNAGYDFGGYQDAIQTLILGHALPLRLLVMNDSVWFPLGADCDLLERLEAAGHDVCAPVYYLHRKAHLCHAQSYMVLYSERAVASQAFRRFWSVYRAASNRTWTIRFGEMRMSEILRRGGLSVGGLTTAHAIAPSEIGWFLDWQQRLRRSGVIEQGPRVDGVFRGYILSNHPRILLGSRRLGLLKKDRGDIYGIQRDFLLRSDEVADLRAGLSPAVATEIAQHDLRPETGRHLDAVPSGNLVPSQ